MLGLLMVLAAVTGPAQAYNEGNRLYAQKDYAHAVVAYERALEAGHDARVHYNLGNALFRVGRLGKAIANYRRAHYLAPRDRDIEGNLEFARAYRADKVSDSAGPLARALDRTLRWMSRREASLLTGLVFTLAALSLSAWIVWRSRLAGYAAASLGVVALYGFVVQQFWAGEAAARPAVVVVAEVSAASGPGEEFKAVMLLHDGTEVKVRETRGDYELVQLPGGSGGWLKKSAVESVY
jgi:tetratricopeptide (TPR) repeat protein